LTPAEKLENSPWFSVNTLPLLLTARITPPVSIMPTTLALEVPFKGPFIAPPENLKMPLPSVAR
jgi:hypothetical protein